MITNSDLIDSASILVIRDNSNTGKLEVLMVRRHDDIDFAGGTYVFPGGKVDPEDLKNKVRVPGFPDGYSKLIVTAVREVFEESQLMIGDPHLINPHLDALISNEITVTDLIANNGVEKFVDYVIPFARWITPRIFPKRYDTRFFLARAPENQIAVPDDHEIVDIKWAEPLDFIRENKEILMFPTIMNLKLLGQANSVDEAVDFAKRRKIMTVEPKIVGGKRVIDPAAGYGEIDQENIHPGVKGNPR